MDHRMRHAGRNTASKPQDDPCPYPKRGPQQKRGPPGPNDPPTTATVTKHSQQPNKFKSQTHEPPTPHEPQNEFPHRGTLNQDTDIQHMPPDPKEVEVCPFPEEHTSKGDLHPRKADEYTSTQRTLCGCDGK
ncbi:hypothetical protein CRENBAI_026859 [Crenichthys baileyi]|uniref:Uncharacterized protein n=1 Tax=Crenichthys baileyi TaxID=28760 RepID=A0AAV9SAC7_9TELE